MVGKTNTKAKYSTCVGTRYENGLVNNFETHGASYKEDTRMGHIQRERLPKSKMACSDDRFTFESCCVLKTS